MRRSSAVFELDRRVDERLSPPPHAPISRLDPNENLFVALVDRGRARARSLDAITVVLLVAISCSVVLVKLRGSSS